MERIENLNNRKANLLERIDIIKGKISELNKKTDKEKIERLTNRKANVTERLANVEANIAELKAKE